MSHLWRIWSRKALKIELYFLQQNSFGWKGPNLYWCESIYGRLCSPCFNVLRPSQCCLRGVGGGGRMCTVSRTQQSLDSQKSLSTRSLNSWRQSCRRLKGQPCGYNLKHTAKKWISSCYSELKILLFTHNIGTAQGTQGSPASRIKFAGCARVGWVIRPVCSGRKHRGCLLIWIFKCSQIRIKNYSDG